MARESVARRRGKRKRTGCAIGHGTFVSAEVSFGNCASQAQRCASQAQSTRPRIRWQMLISAIRDFLAWPLELPSHGEAAFARLIRKFGEVNH